MEGKAEITKELQTDIEWVSLNAKVLKHSPTLPGGRCDRLQSS